MRDSPRDNQYISVRDLSQRGRGNSRVTKLLGGLSYEKIRRYNNSPPYVTARWPPQQIPPLNFLAMYSNGDKMLVQKKVKMILFWVLSEMVLFWVSNVRQVIFHKV